MNTFGQIMGFVALGVSSLIYIQKKRKNMIVMKLITDFLWMAHHFCIASYTAMGTTMIAVAREIVFMNDSRHEKRHNGGKMYVIIFSVLFFISGILTWRDSYSILPPIASTIATAAFNCMNVKKIRLLSLIVSVCMMCYSVHYMSYASIVNEIITQTTIVVALFLDKEKN